MSVFRPTYQAVIPPDATRSTKKGRQMARFRLAKSGRMVEGPVTLDGKRVTIQSDVYFCRIRRNGRTQRVSTGTSDKASAVQIMAQLQLAADQQRAGIIDRYASHRDTPLADHIRDYQDHLTASGNCEQYVTEMIRLLLRVCKACQFQHQEQFSASSLERYLTGVAKSRSYRTRNKALKVMIAFVRWMQKTDRMDEANPFRTISLLNQDADPGKKQRRTLTVAELGRLVAAAEKAAPIQSVTGRERGLIYLTAYATGLRRSELAKIECRHVVLDDDTPYIALPAPVAKSKRADIVPLHPVIAERLADWVVGKRPAEKLFHLMTDGGKVRLTSKMMKRDCGAAGIEYKNDFGTCDFHGHRASFITNLCRTNTDFSLIVKLARHSTPKLTSLVYDKARIGEKAAAVNLLQLPMYSNPSSD